MTAGKIPHNLRHHVPAVMKAYDGAFHGGRNLCVPRVRRAIVPWAFQDMSLQSAKEQTCLRHVLKGGRVIALSREITIVDGFPMAGSRRRKH